MRAHTGRFITFEGVEGAGKSTQVRRLAAHLAARGIDALVTREPGGTALGGRIRELLLDTTSRGLDPVAELMLYAADRRQHVTEVIGPALKAGRIVLCDRFSDSTVAYQCGGRGVQREVVDTLIGMATGGLAPDLTILLDVEPEVGLGRNVRGGKTDRFELEALGFHMRVRAMFHGLAWAEPRRMRVIDSSGDAEATQALVAEAVVGFLREG